MKKHESIGLYIFLAVCLALFAQSCKKEPPVEPEKPATLTLKAEDASCTEAWLKATTTEPPATVRLLRDGQRVSDLRLLTSDSLLLDEGLLPNRSYTYQLQKLDTDSSVIETSTSVQVTTMDTTGHNFTWQIDALGATSSVLYDVAIINDTLAYAVGEMYLRDSTGQLDPLLYNLAKWNGQRWELKRVIVLFRGNLITPSLNGIFAFSATDIWLAGGMAVHGDGTNWVSYDVRTITGYDTLSFTKCWGRNPSDMYFVGLRGSLAHYANGTWRRVESGTNADLQNVYGYSNQHSGPNVTLAVASSSLETKILTMSGNGANDTLSWFATQRLRGIWMSNRFVVYVSGSGVWRHADFGWRQMPNQLTSQFLTSVRGTGENNLFAVAWRGVATHFNGVSWRAYTEIPTDFSFDAVAVSPNIVMAVGFTGGVFADRAAVAIGKRSP